MRPSENSCDGLLKSPGITSVRIFAGNRASSTYRIVPNTTPGVRARATGYGMLDEDRVFGSRSNALEAEWNLMLSKGKALIVSDDKTPPDFTIMIEKAPVIRETPRSTDRSDWSLKPSVPVRKALSIQNAKGEVLLRQSILSVSAPFAPLLIGMAGGIESFRFQWGRQRLGDGRRWAEIPVDRLLLDNTDLSRGVDIEAMRTETRAALVRAIDDPSLSAGDPGLALANQWMGSLGRGAPPFNDEDRHLLARIVGDWRVQSSQGLWVAVSRIADDAADLRALAARRYLAATDQREQAAWINRFAALPAGAYATQLPEEREILADPAVSRYATGLIERQGDRGVKAVPDLLRLLHEFSSYDPATRDFSDLTEATNSVRRAFRRIGPAASFARPQIEALLNSPRMDHRYKRLNKREWDTLLVVLGRPVETLDKPEGLSGNNARYRELVARSAARPYDARGER